MDWTTSVAVHESASPEFTRRRIIDALRRGEVEPVLLYSGVRQASLWTRLHQTISPAHLDSSVLAIYDAAFGQAAAHLKGNVAHLVSLACGSGSKDLRAIAALRSAERAVLYTPVDFGLEMVLSACKGAGQQYRGMQCTPLLCELSGCSVLPAILKSFDPSGAERLVLFLGTIHNYWPPEILKTILYPLRAQDRLLISANLAPAADYEAALARIKAQYDNPPTRAWLMGALSEFGINEGDGRLEFELPAAEEMPDLRRIEAQFRFDRARELDVLGDRIAFEAGSRLRVFYSYRFTDAQIRSFLEGAGFTIGAEWVTAEEGLFLCERGKTDE